MNGAHWLDPCLASIRAGSAQPLQIVVCDDGSTDASAEVCARHGATFLPSPAPAGSGFAATVNRGLGAVDHEATWVMLLNNDTEMHPACLATLMDAATRHPEVAILAPLVRSLREPALLDSAGLLLYPDGVARPRWHGEAAADLDLREEQILLASGAAMAIRHDLLRDVGGFDEAMGSFVEDVDWGLRAARRGAVAMLIPSAEVRHHFSGTVGAVSPRKARLVERNRLVVAARHLPMADLIASPVWTLRRWSALRRSGVGAGQPGTSTAALKGFGEGLLRLPGALLSRRTLARSDRTTGAEWRARVRRHRCGPEAFTRFGGQ